VAALSVMPLRSVLIVKGPDPVAALDVTGAVVAPKILIVGQGAAAVGAGSGDPAGVHLSVASKVYVRNLAISGGTVGLVAEGGTELHLTRAVITHNDKGGIRTTNVGFDITNTIVAANGPGSDTGGVAFGGVRLGAIANGLSNFANNTVVSNMQVGISCGIPYDVSTNIIHGNNGGDALNCTGGMCCGAGDPDPKLDTATYRLMSGSPCIDKITPTASTVTVDIDGQARPTPPMTAKLDCGADEFIAP